MKNWLVILIGVIIAAGVVGFIIYKRNKKALAQEVDTDSQENETENTSSNTTGSNSSGSGFEVDWDNVDPNIL